MKAVRKSKKLRDSIKGVKKGEMEYKRIKRELLRAIVTQRRINSQVPHPNLLPTIKYVRYADDWLVGV